MSLNPGIICVSKDNFKRNILSISILQGHTAQANIMLEYTVCVAHTLLLSMFCKGSNKKDGRAFAAFFKSLDCLPSVTATKELVVPN